METTIKNKKIEFFITQIEGEVVATSDQEALNAYNIEISKYFKRERELNKIAYKNEKEVDLLNIFNSDDKPAFNVEDRMKEEGYFYQSFYSYNSGDGKNGHGIYETPFSKIETFLLDQDISFLNSDGVCVANKKVVITFKI